MRSHLLLSVVVAACGSGTPNSAAPDTTSAPPSDASVGLAGPDAPADTAGELAMEDVQEHMGPIRDAVKACAAATTFEGKVSVRVTIQPSGEASAALETPSGDATIDRCLVDAFADAEFPASERGQRFQYSFTF